LDTFSRLVGEGQKRDDNLVANEAFRSWRLKRYGKGKIPSVELENGVNGCPFPPFGNRDFVEFLIEAQGLIKALAWSTLQDALQFDITGPVTPAKHLESVFGVPHSFCVEVVSKFGAIPIGLEGTDWKSGSEEFEPKGMEVGGNGNGLIGFQEFAKRGELQRGDDLVDCHETVVPQTGSIEFLAHRPDPRRFMSAELRVVIGEEFQIRTFARSTGSMKNKQAFLFERTIGQSEKVMEATIGFRLAFHAS